MQDHECSACNVARTRSTQLFADLVLFNGSSHISSIDSAVVEIGEVLDVGQDIAAVVRRSCNGVLCQIDEPQLLELPKVHHVIEG